MRMGLPRVLLSDNGSEFCNELNDQLAEMLGIKRRLTTPYHPQVCFVNATFFHVNRMCNWLFRLFGY